MWYGMADTLFEHENPTPAWYKSKVCIFDSKIHKVVESQVKERYDSQEAARQKTIFAKHFE